MGRYIRLKDTLIDKDDILMVCYNEDYKQDEDYSILIILQNQEDLEIDFIREDWLKEAIDYLENEFKYYTKCDIIQLVTGTYINLNKISMLRKKTDYDRKGNFICAIEVSWKQKMILPKTFIIQGGVESANKILDLLQERG